MPCVRRTAFISLLSAACLGWPVAAQEPGERPDRPRERREEPRKRGLIRNESGAFPGFTLFAPLQSTMTYLVDMQGNLAHKWESRFQPGQSVYLLSDGTLLRAARQPKNQHFSGGGIGGRVERLSRDGTVLWEYALADEKRCLHHDIEPLPNGNILMIAWEKKSRDDALQAGRDPKNLQGDEFWPDAVLELEPEGKSGGRIVWE